MFSLIRPLSAQPFVSCCRFFSSSPSSSPPVFPPLSAVLRRFFLLVHPDLFTQFPRQQAVNADSVQRLNSLLTEIKATDSLAPYPAAQFLNLTFFVKKREGDRIQPATGGKMKKQKKMEMPKNSTVKGRIIEGEFHLITSTIALTGGECKKPVERGLGGLFTKVNLPNQFRWDSDYWKLKPPQRLEEEEEFEDEAPQ